MKDFGDMLGSNLIGDRISAIFFSKDGFEQVRLDSYREADGQIILHTMSSKIAGAMKFGEDRDYLSDIKKGIDRYDLVAIMRQKEDRGFYSALKEFDCASAFVMEVDLVSFDSESGISNDTAFGGRDSIRFDRIEKKATMVLRERARWDISFKDGDEFMAELKKIRREIKLRDAGI